MHLPIDSIREQVCMLPEGGRLVLSSPTGSGKSTQVPRWFREKGRVLVVEPRRVACRSLASRVAELDKHTLGIETGYVVRDDNCSTKETSVLFATPGIVLKMIQSSEHLDFATIIIDEFHERSLDTDLLLALLRSDSASRLIVMSATLDGDAIAKHLGGEHLHAEGRLHPVRKEYAGVLKDPPTSKHLDSRVSKAIDEVESLPGDILVFLPGKAEIAAVCQQLSSRKDLDVLPLHGGLTLKDQAKIFEPSPRRKVIVSTNVAETSLTVPGIGVVIDSGLVRQTRYHNGRGFLSLVPIAADSADQRAGRAGRTGPGVCIRLWAKGSRLEERTRPEIHRESLVPLLLSAIACGHTMNNLEFLSPPKAYALEQAEEELRALGAFDHEGKLSPVGRELFKLPMDPGLGRLLIESQNGIVDEDMVDLVSGLAVGRNLFRQPPGRDDEDDLRAGGSDALGWIMALRIGDVKTHKLDPFAVKEARRISDRLRKAFGLRSLKSNQKKPNMEALAQVILKADPRTAHVARQRGKYIAWSNGGTEIEVGRECSIEQDKWSAIAVLSSRAMKTEKGATVVLATCVLPLPLPWLVRAGLGRERISQTTYVKGQIEATVERVYARKIIGTHKTNPTGALARDALVELLLRGSLFRREIDATKERFERWKLAEELVNRSLESFEITPISSESFEDWIRNKVEALGVESGEDIQLLSGSDFSLPKIDSWIESTLDKTYPATVSAGDATYQIKYHLQRRTVCLVKVSGRRKDLPSLQYLPRFKGFAIEVEDRGKIRQLRPRK